MSSNIIKKESFDFLKTLSKNNNRNWFNTNKNKYLDAQNNVIDFADSLLFEMNKHDTIETSTGKKSLFRIYKEVYLSKI